MRKPKLLPDNRLDWRDADMPCLRIGHVNGRVGLHEIEPNKIKQYYSAKMKLYQHGEGPPHYKHDPSYWWNKRNRK